MNANTTAAKKIIRALQAHGFFRPFNGFVGNGVGRRAHLIARLRPLTAQQEAANALHVVVDDFVEVSA